MIDDDGNALLCDFGLSRLHYDVTRSLTAIRSGGKLRFLSPELTSSDDAFRTTETSDVYSLAMLVYELLYEVAPFHDVTNDLKVIHLTQHGSRPTRRALKSDRSSTHAWVEAEGLLWILIQGMWADAAQRSQLSSVHSEVASRPLFFAPQVLKY